MKESEKEARRKVTDDRENKENKERAYKKERRD